MAARRSRATPEKFGWLRQLMEFQRDLKDPAEFLESVKVDLFPDEVYVFTPKGDVRVFPRGVDARRLRLRDPLGGRRPLLRRARVNGQIVPLRYKLRNGDVIEIMTVSRSSPAKTGSTS